MFSHLESIPPERESSFRVLVAEDNDSERAELIKAVQQLRPDWLVYEALCESDALLRSLDELAPKLLILHAKAKSGATVDMLETFPYRVPMIFVADTAELAVKAFDRAALDYLLKPVKLGRLERALARIGDRSGDVSKEPRTPGLKYIDWVTATKGDETVVIPCEDILYLQSQLKYTRVVWPEGEALIRRGLTALQDHFDPRKFYRIHRGTVVNMRHVVRLRKDELGRMRLQVRGRPELLVVSQAYEHQFRLPV